MVGGYVRGLTDFVMDQNFLASLVHVESRIKKCSWQYGCWSQLIFVSQGFEFTEPVLGVVFLTAPVTQFTLRNVLANFPINPGGAWVPAWTEWIS